MELRSPLGRARGLGSTNDAAGHWWAERLGALALVPLSLWFVYSAIGLVGADLAQFKEWVGAHSNPVLLILLIVVMFHHGSMGLQVILEDYVHNETAKVTAIIVTKFTAVLFGAASSFAVLKLAFGG